MTYTVPTPEDARKAALARREADQTKQNEELLLERSELFGEAQLLIEELMTNVDADDIPVLRVVIGVLEGKSVAASSTPALSAEEQELVDAFRSGRVERTDKGAFRDKEWGKLHPRQPKAPAKDDTVSDKTSQQMADVKDVVDREVEKVKDDGKKKSKDKQSEPAPQPQGLRARSKGLLDRAFPPQK